MGKILVTGAAGFLGVEIVRQALAAGMTIRAADRRPGRLSELGAEYVLVDICEPATLDQAVSGCTCLIHAAGLAHLFGRVDAAAADFYRVNEAGTAHVTQAAVRSGVEHLVLVSSVAVYGGNVVGPCDESASCRPVGPYARSKWYGERRAAELIAGTGTALTILRLATIYGEEDPGNIARLVRAIDRGRFLWIGHGTNLKSLIHREDAARACLLAAQGCFSGTRLFNVSAPPCPMAEVVASLATALGRSVPPVRVPGPVALVVARAIAALSLHRLRPDETVRKWLADDVYPSDAIRRALGFETMVGLHEGLYREVAWYRGQRE